MELRTIDHRLKVTKNSTKDQFFHRLFHNNCLIFMDIMPLRPSEIVNELVIRYKWWLLSK